MIHSYHGGWKVLSVEWIGINITKLYYQTTKNALYYTIFKLLKNFLNQNITSTL